jgi:hypothetical protein
MHGISAALAGYVEGIIEVQVAVVGRGFANKVGFVGQPGVEGVPVYGGINGHRLDPQFAAGVNDPAGDLAPVCYQYLAKQTFP